MAMCNYADLAQVRGEPGAMELVREAARLEGDDLIPNAHWGPGTVLGRALVGADEVDEARALLEGRHRRAVESGDDDSRSGLLLYLAELEMRAGRFDAALRLGIRSRTELAATRPASDGRFRSPAPPRARPS
jgi:hypothetical protein